MFLTASGWNDWSEILPPVLFSATVSPTNQREVLVINSLLSDFDTPELTPEERLTEIAAILATGTLRLRTAAVAPGKNLPESGHDPLEVSPKSRLSVTTG